MNVRTDIYERVNGHKPRGRGYWRFKLVTDRVTEKITSATPKPTKAFTPL